MKIYSDRCLHWMMSLVGGFLGTYAISSREGIFASAQTGNLMNMMESLCIGDMKESVLRLVFAAVFAAALVISYLLKAETKQDLRGSCIAVDSVALIITCGIPETVEPLLAILPISFAASYQWGTCAGADGYNSATIFSTNNLKQFTWGFTEYFRSGSKMALDKGCFYGLTLLMFLTGAWLGIVAVDCLGTRGGIIGLIPLVFAYLILLNLRKTENSEPGVNFSQPVKHF